MAISNINYLQYLLPYRLKINIYEVPKMMVRITANII